MLVANKPLWGVEPAASWHFCMETNCGDFSHRLLELGANADAGITDAMHMAAANDVHGHFIFGLGELVK
jgi:hypothetical protein